MCPKKVFNEELEVFLLISAQDRHSASLDIDAYEHMCIGKLARIIRQFVLVDTIKTVVLNAPPASHVNRSKKLMACGPLETYLHQ